MLQKIMNPNNPKKGPVVVISLQGTLTFIPKSPVTAVKGTNIVAKIVNFFMPLFILSEI